MKDITKEVKRILEAIEGEPLRKDLIETPQRVQRAFEEMMSGYAVDVPSLFKSFEEGLDQIVCVKDIPFYSTCEHHLEKFFGTVHVAYLPKGRAIGASKIPRIVEAYAHRLQIQERLAEQIAHALMENLDPYGVCVIIEATHLCVRCRGIKSSTAVMKNSIMLGVFRQKQALRMEVLSLLQ